MNNRWTVKISVPDDCKVQIEIPSHIPSGPATLAIEVVPDEDGYI